MGQGECRTFSKLLVVQSKYKNTGEVGFSGRGMGMIGGAQSASRQEFGVILGNLDSLESWGQTWMNIVWGGVGYLMEGDDSGCDVGDGSVGTWGTHSKWLEGFAFVGSQVPRQPRNSGMDESAC